MTRVRRASGCSADKSASGGSKRIAGLRKRAVQVSEAQAVVATKAVGYMRVSTDEQAAHGFGLANQERALRAFATSQGYELVELVSDPGVSGATRPADRPGFDRVVELASAGTAHVLLVFKFDRLARSIVFAVTAVNDLAERHGMVVRSVTEPIDTATPMGRTVFAILAGMAEQERQAITERTHGGRREKALRGGFSCGLAPYGYATDGQGKLVVVDREAVVVQRAFALRAGGHTLAQVTATLNAEGHRTRRKKPWAVSSVSYLLDNPKYAGRVEYLFQFGGEPTHVLRRGKHKAIVA